MLNRIMPTMKTREVDASLESPGDTKKRPSVLSGSGSGMTRTRSASFEMSMMRSASVIDSANKDAAKAKRQATLMGYFGLTMALFLAISALANFAIIYRVVDDQVQTTTDSRGVMHPKGALGNTSVVQTGRLKTYSTLGDLPCQSTDYLGKINQIMLNLDGRIVKYTIDGYEWHNTSYMELITSKPVLPQGDGVQPTTTSTVKIVINGHLCYVDYGNGQLGHVSFTTQVSDRRHLLTSKPRMLADIVAFPTKNVRTYSWDELVAKFEEEAGANARARARKLNAEFSTITAMYQYFGGAAEAESLEYTTVVTGSSFCGTALSTAVTPAVPNLPLRAKWTISGMPTTNSHDASTGVYYFDMSNLDTPSLHFVSHVGMAWKHEVQVGDQHYMYNVFDSAGAIAIAQNPNVTASDLHAMDGVQQQCTVVTRSSSELVTPDTTAVVEIAPDGSATWNVGGFQLTAAVDGTVTGFAGLTVDSVEEWSGNVTTGGGMPLFSSCSVGADRRALEEIGEYMTPDGRRKLSAGETLSSRRKLSATAFQAWASGTQWCGAGTDLDNTPCPWTQDDDGDMACHRHDHGKKANGIIGGMAVRLGCDIDRGLADRTSNWAAQAIFGSWGIAQAWGCYDHGSYSCWNWKSKWWGGYWRYGGYCSGEHTHYGPWRYSDYSHSYGWNSQTRCSTSLSFVTGHI